MPRDCIFCRIADGELPSTKIFENDRMLCFMDISPIAEGHVLLIPKEHYKTITDMPAELVGEMFSQVPRLGRAVMDATKAEGINVLQNNGRCAGQVVSHLHVHLIPRWSEDGLGFRWPAKDADP
ncbi:MAG: HIT family protein, partial [Phycisphaerae bacterium]|nr:HIT family protein [Phycisphaerae bacterium]